MSSSKRTASTAKSSSSTTTRRTVPARSSTVSPRNSPYDACIAPASSGFRAASSTAGNSRVPNPKRSARWTPTSATTSTSCRRWFRRSHRGYGLAIGSRYVKGGGITNWPAKRIVTSKVACWLARPLTNVKDITSGYFFVKREALDGVELDPIGFKIGLEVVAKAHYGSAHRGSVRLHRPHRRRVEAERKRNLQLPEAAAQALQRRGSFRGRVRTPCRCPNGCASAAARTQTRATRRFGASARSATRCCTGAISPRTSTSARSAAIISG